MSDAAIVIFWASFMAVLTVATGLSDPLVAFALWLGTLGGYYTRVVFNRIDAKRIARKGLGED